jgi:hypothetical protein
MHPREIEDFLNSGFWEIDPTRKATRAACQEVLARCASPKFYAQYEWRDSLPRRLPRPGYPFTLERQESLAEERPRGIPVYIKDGGMRTFSRR